MSDCVVQLHSSTHRLVTWSVTQLYSLIRNRAAPALCSDWLKQIESTPVSKPSPVSGRAAQRWLEKRIGATVSSHLKSRRSTVRQEVEGSTERQMRGHRYVWVGGRSCFLSCCCSDDCASVVNNSGVPGPVGRQVAAVVQASCWRQ